LGDSGCETACALDGGVKAGERCWIGEAGAAATDPDGEAAAGAVAGGRRLPPLLSKLRELRRILVLGVDEPFERPCTGVEVAFMSCAERGLPWGTLFSTMGGNAGNGGKRDAELMKPRCSVDIRNSSSTESSSATPKVSGSFSNTS